MENPKLISISFAENGEKNEIPAKYQTSLEANKATWEIGFSRATMIPASAGGLPPFGQDFNGIFYALSNNLVHAAKGGKYKFSDDYAEAIDGYPKGAVLQSDDETKEFQSLVNSNKINFNTASDADLASSWKQVSSNDILDLINAKQPKGDYATNQALNQVKAKIPAFATNEEAQAGIATDKIISPATLASVVATTEQQGLIQIATDEEVTDGTNTAKAITPASLVGVFSNSSLKTSGYQMLPGGLIIQWGFITVGNNAFTPFPITFPNGFFSLTGNDCNASTGGGQYFTYRGATVSGFYALPSSKQAMSLSYIAIGY